jgi:hypothetical protein
LRQANAIEILMPALASGFGSRQRPRSAALVVSTAAGATAQCWVLPKFCRDQARAAAKKALAAIALGQDPQAEKAARGHR